MVEARAEFEGARKRYRDALHREKDDFQASLSQRARAEVIAIANRLLGDLADSDLQQRMAGKFVQRLEELSDTEQRRMREAVSESTERVATLRSAVELDPECREKLSKSVRDWLGGASLQFEVLPSLVCGVELAVDGQKVAWSVQDYMRSLTSCLDDLLK